MKKKLTKCVSNWAPLVRPMHASNHCHVRASSISYLPCGNSFLLETHLRRKEMGALKARERKYATSKATWLILD